MKPEMYWIDESLALLMRPRGDDWLADEIRAWKDAGINVVVSLLAAYEITELGLTREAAVCQSADLEFFWFPIEDLSVPDHLLDTIKLIDTLTALQHDGKTIGIHCRQSLGRAPLIAACLLVRKGVASTTAWEIIGAARGTTVPETDEQREWLNRFVEELQTLTATS